MATRTRRERADRVKKEERSFFDEFGSEAKAILAALLEKYAEHGTAQFVIFDGSRTADLGAGNVIEIASCSAGRRS